MLIALQIERLKILIWVFGKKIQIEIFKGSPNYHRLSRKLIMSLAKLFHGLFIAMKIFKCHTYEIKLLRNLIEILIWKGNNLTRQPCFSIKTIPYGAIEQSQRDGKRFISTFLGIKNHFARFQRIRRCQRLFANFANLGNQRLKLIYADR